MKKILLAILVMDFILMVLNIIEIIHEGFFRDIYPTIIIKDEITYFFWISLLLTLIVFALILYSLLKEQGNKRTVILRIVGIFAFGMLMVTNLYFGNCYKTLAKPYKLDALDEQDYMLSDYFRGISLDELKLDLQADVPVLIYIGREDCNTCKEFEKNFEGILKEYYTEIPTYYTTQDRDGVRNKEMYQVLGKYNIDSVPIVILAQNSKVIKIWNDPIEQLDDIQTYL